LARLPPPDDARLVSQELDALIARHLPVLKIRERTALVGGDLNESVIVELVNEDRFVARHPRRPASPWAPNVAGQVAAHQLASEQGVPVPEIIGFDEVGLVYRYVSGRSISSGVALHRPPVQPASETPDLAYNAGLIYGRLHQRVGRGLGPMQADRSDPAWPPASYFQALPQQAERLLARDLTDGALAAADIEATLALLTQHPIASRSRLVHGDASPANTLVNDHDEVVAIIDFDAAAWADPAIDLAGWWYHSPDTAAAFQAGCEAVSEPTDDRTLRVFRLRHLLGLADAIIDLDPAQTARVGHFLGKTLEELS
jgi:aminoglycoside phosphotransferase (APT) family kinase protein